MAEDGSSRRVTSPLERHQSPKGCERDRNRDRDTDSEHNKENWNRGPRSLFLKRSENGFGFTLRHFIVYPPESYTVLSRDRCLGLRGGEWDEPMDTIFVKHVRPNSPASIAGLETGDRIVSVNGETICGKSYAHVVQLIHQSANYLHLLVVPKEDDILQLYFGDTAHNPETNPRPRLRSPEMVSGVGDLRQHGQPNTPVSTHNSRLTSHQRDQQQRQLHGVPSPYHTPWDDVRLHSPQRICSINVNTTGRRASEGSSSTSSNNNKTGFVAPSSSSGSAMTGGLPSEMYGSSESMPNYIPPNLPGCRLSLDAGIMGQHDSNSHDSSASSLDSTSRDLHSSDDSLIINRIRKSFEQKEEFLKRPTAPIWVGGGSELIPQKEFYARPQKLQTPVWPPAIPASPRHSPARKQLSNEEFVIERGNFVCGGPVTNVPNQDLTRGSRSRGTPGFVTTLGRIQENGKVIELSSSTTSTTVPLSRLALVSQRARQFESGRIDDNELPDRTSLYKSELARLTEKRSNPNVAVRKREFEAKLERRGFSNRESRSLDSSGIPSSTLQHTSPVTPTPVGKVQSVSTTVIPASYSALSVSATANSTTGLLSGNRTIPIGNYKLHCEPPVNFFAESTEEDPGRSSKSFDNTSPTTNKETEKSRPRSNSAESAWLGDAWPHRHKAVRQDSYLAACRKPIRTSESNQRKEDVKLDNDSKKSSVKTTDGSSDDGKCNRFMNIEKRKPAVRPNKLDLPNPIRPASQVFLRNPSQDDGQFYLTEKVVHNEESEDSITPLMSPNLVSSPRSPQNESLSPGAEDDRNSRRVSYLKATSNDRMNVDSEPDVSDSETQHRTPQRSVSRVKKLVNAQLDNVVRNSKIENLKKIFMPPSP